LQGSEALCFLQTKRQTSSALLLTCPDFSRLPSLIVFLQAVSNLLVFLQWLSDLVIQAGLGLMLNIAYFLVPEAQVHPKTKLISFVCF
jgi:hypothetical protein